MMINQAMQHLFLNSFFKQRGLLVLSWVFLCHMINFTVSAIWPSIMGGPPAPSTHVSILKEVFKYPLLHVSAFCHCRLEDVAIKKLLRT